MQAELTAITSKSDADWLIYAFKKPDTGSTAKYCKTRFDRDSVSDAKIATKNYCYRWNLLWKLCPLYKSCLPFYEITINRSHSFLFLDDFVRAHSRMWHMHAYRRENDKSHGFLPVTGNKIFPFKLVLSQAENFTTLILMLQISD